MTSVRAGSTPAILGGDPVFVEPVPFARPSVEEPSRVLELIERSLESGMLTNGPLVRRLEEAIAERLGVEHCVAVASCTTGLMLTVQAIGGEGVVAVPSFTFSATAHAVAWNSRRLRFIDCDPGTWLVGPSNVPDDVDLVVATHVSGVACDVAGLEQRCAEIDAALMFDAAHGLGSATTIDGTPTPLGRFGRAEVFSLTPTKVLSGAEGGLVTTDDEELADRIRLARDYANPGDYDTRFVGLNGRLSELHAALVLVGLDHLDDRVARRTRIAEQYRSDLADIEGVAWQQVPDGVRSSFKDFIITIDANRFGANRQSVVDALAAEGVPTRPYYAPPVHRQQAYRHLEAADLPVTDTLAAGVIALPIWSEMSPEQAEGVVTALRRIRAHAAQLGDE